MNKIKFSDFVKKFNEKDEKNKPYYFAKFRSIYGIDKNENGDYHIINLSDFSAVCKLPVWLNQFFLEVERNSKYKIRKEIKEILEIE